MRKRWTHDCDDCEFLGDYQHDDEDYDLYYCPKSDGGTILARYDDEGSSYTSLSIELMMHAGLGMTHPLTIGARRKVTRWRMMEATA